jgi:HSP20 family protein
MKLDLSKWNPFKFFRKTPEEKRVEPSSSTALATTAGNVPTAWPESLRLLTADPLRMVQELWRDPFAGFGQLDRWFGDFSPSVFQPRIDVVDDGDALRITAELPGIDRQDVEILVEDDALVLRGERNWSPRVRNRAVTDSSAPSAVSNASSPCPMASMPTVQRPVSRMPC